MDVEAVPHGLDRAGPATLDGAQTLVLAFGAPGSVAHDDARRTLAATFPQARVVGCSTAAAPSTTAIRFRRVGLRLAEAALPAGPDGVAAAEALVREVCRTGPNEAPPGLVFAVVRRAGDDLDDVLAAVRRAVPPTTALAGAVAGGGDEAWVVSGTSTSVGDAVVAVALHGRDLEVHQRLASHPASPPTAGAVTFGASSGSAPADVRIGAGGVLPLHRLAEGPGEADAVVTTLVERSTEAAGADGAVGFDDVETQVTEIPVHPSPSRVAPRAAAERVSWFATGGWSSSLAGRDSERTLVLARAAAGSAGELAPLRQLGQVLPHSHVVGWSDAVVPGGAAVSAQVRRFERLTIRTASAPLRDDADGAARQVHAALAAPDLALVLGVWVPGGPGAVDARALAAAFAPVPVLTVAAAARAEAEDATADAPFGWEGGRAGGARWIAVGLYRAEAPSFTIAGPDPVEAFWRAAERLDRPLDESSLRPLPRGGSSGGPTPGVSSGGPTPGVSSGATSDDTRGANRPESVAPTSDRSGPVPSPNAAAPQVRSGFATPVPPPPLVAALELTERARVTDAAFDLRVREVDELTIVTVSGALDGGLDAALEGGLADRLGGVVLADLDGVEAVTEVGATAWTRLAQAVTARGGTLFVARCSEAAALVVPFTHGEHVLSVFVPYRCACGATFSALHALGGPGAVGRLAASVMCPACGNAVPPDGFDPARLGGTGSSAPAAVTEAVAGLPRRESWHIVGVPARDVPLGAELPARDGSVRMSRLAAAVVAALAASVGFAIIVVLGAIGLRWALSSSDPVAPGSHDDVLPPLTAEVEDRGDLPPPWVEARLTVSDTTVLSVGRGAGSSSAEALERARTDALSVLIDGVAEALGDASSGPLVAASVRRSRTPDMAAAAIVRFEGHLRAAGIPAPDRDRTWTRTATDGAEVELAVRYALDRGAWDRLVAAYRETVTWRTFDVALLFPTMAAQLPVGGAELVVVSVADGERLVRVGDVVDAVGGRPVRTVAGFRDTIDADWRDGDVTVTVIANGLPHDVRFFRKAAPAPSRQGRSLSSPR